MKRRAALRSVLSVGEGMAKGKFRFVAEAKLLRGMKRPAKEGKLKKIDSKTGGQTAFRDDGAKRARG